VKRVWHLIDAKNKVLGRLSTEVVNILMGKNKNYYTPYLDAGDYVVIINAKEITLTGDKNKQKKYYRHSGYPGGLYIKSASQIRSDSPEKLLRHSIRGMLPKTRLGKIMIKKLFVYPQSDHPHESMFKNQQS